MRRMIEMELEAGGRHGRTLQHHLFRQVSERIVHRVPVADQRKILQSPRFAGNTRLEAALSNAPPMRQGETGEAVKIIQQALIDDGFPMPISTRKLGEPDGIFGPETFKTVQGFQVKYGLLENGVADGVIGRHTMGKLDELYAHAPPPKKKDPEIEATDKAIGQHVVEGMDRANLDPHTADSGIHYAENYESAFPSRWREDFRTGFAPPAYWEKLGFMEWRLKPHVSAADGIRAWLNGLTIAECQTTVIAIEFDTLRAGVGDDKFDSKFGTSDRVTAEAERMVISPRGNSQISAFFKPTEASIAGELGTIGNRPNIKEGEWYYFYNHPKYLLKHPGGAWQGENSIYMGRNAAGEQTWAGLGTFSARSGSTHVTERQMYEEMIAAYNAPRDVNDERALTAIRTGNGGTLPPEYVEPIDGGTVFEDRIDENKLLNDPEFTINGTTRKGGFQLSAGTVLDVAKVQALRNL
jgi:peptidoglycan hydrolase-like protein with peptidoglycan-binding domain